MTKINDPIRLASLYTMNGLVDPRFFETTDTPLSRKQTLFRKSPDLFGLAGFIEEFALRRSIFRYKNLKA